MGRLLHAAPITTWCHCMAAPEDARLSGERILDELRARMLRNYARAR